jgi:uncharacterized membrane protein YdfJ with MMPL/SSD domain
MATSQERAITAAAASLIDATLVRMVLVPSITELVGDANWCMPSWLGRVVPAWVSRWTSTCRGIGRRCIE